MTKPTEEFMCSISASGLNLTAEFHENKVVEGFGVCSGECNAFGGVVLRLRGLPDFVSLVA
jgi:hypothetical protein